MKLLSRALNTLPKRIVAGATIALALAFPAAVSASQTVKIEAQTGVANVTAKDTTYKSSVNASYDQVVKVEVTYNNDEAAGSGKVAKNLSVKINIPNKPGKTQKITTITKADNGNKTITGHVTVNLDRSDAYLQYLPGSAVWKHSISANSSKTKEQIVSDAVVGPNGLVLENENPCQAGSVTVLARVMVPGVKIVKQSEVASPKIKNQWSNNNTAKPGDTLKYLISYQNTGNTVEKNVIIRDSLPPHMTLVPGTTSFANATYPNGKPDKSNNIVNGGIIIGNYKPRANAFVEFEVKIDDASKLACGKTEFRNVGVAHPEGMNEYYNTAITTVDNKCQPQPKVSTPTCDLLTVTKKGDRKIEAQVKYTADGAKLKTVTYDFGDKTTPLTTNKTDVTYTYAKYGNHDVTASLLFSVNGKDQTVNSDSCTKTVSFSTPKTPTPPTTTSKVVSQLPNTGPGNIAGLFAGVAVVSALGYRLFLARRLARQQ